MVLQNVSLNVNNNFTKTEYKSFYLKKKVWEAIRIGHNWTKRGSISRFAEALGITRQYASLIVSGKAGCSAFVMRKIVNLMNLHNACWCFMFEQARCDDVDPNHPVLNSLKEAGEVPYSHYSESAALRSQDYETERNPI